RVRCAAYDRLPLAGPAGEAADDLPGLWVLTGLGSRGLTLSMLCGELLAARLHGEPLPLDAKLAQSLGTQRLWSRVVRNLA
ncbi:MAG: FAD-dependent cmnm(5)s(2)U34 oxidoreductase, partial [Comamonas sp.]